MRVGNAVAAMGSARREEVERVNRGRAFAELGNGGVLRIRLVLTVGQKRIAGEIADNGDEGSRLIYLRRFRLRPSPDSTRSITGAARVRSPCRSASSRAATI